MKKKSKFGSIIFALGVIFVDLLYLFLTVKEFSNLIYLNNWDNYTVKEYVGPCEVHDNPYRRFEQDYKLQNGDIVSLPGDGEQHFTLEFYENNNHFRYHTRETPFGETNTVISLTSADGQTVFLSEKSAASIIRNTAIFCIFIFLVTIAGTIFVYVYFKLWPKIAPKIKHYKNRKERERKKAKRAQQQRREREYIGRISWLKPEEGGRTTPIPFDTNQYGPIIRHKDSHGNWSILVNNYEQVDEFVTLAKMQYLNLEDSPDDLSVGLDFALYEGSKKVAVGKIIDVITPRNNRTKAGDKHFLSI